MTVDPEYPPCRDRSMCHDCTCFCPGCIGLCTGSRDTCGAGFYFPTGNRLPPPSGTGPVRPVTGGNRLNSNPNSNKFKFSRATGSDRFTGRFDRFTGRFYWFTGRFDRFEFKSKFKSSRATGLPAGLTGLPTGLPAGLTGLTGGP